MMVDPGGSGAELEAARLRLARLRVGAEATPDAALRQLTMLSARALGVERVGVWVFEEARQTLRCLCQYHRSQDAYSAGETLNARAYATYVAALGERRVLAAPDARTHPLTSELGPDYLEPHGITSMMDAPIIRDGRVAGVVCHEHVGPPRFWARRARDFAACAADMAALLFEQADRLEIETALRARREAELVDQKMAALGRMARAVAHDVNNVLGALGMIGLALEAQSATDLRKHGADVRRAVGLGRRLVEQLFLFGKDGERAGAPVDLGVLVRRMEPVLLRLMGRASLEIEIATERTTVVAEEAQLEQVVLNLCVNAVEALAADGGVVRLGLREPRPGDETEPGALVLAVEDDGCGMDAETQAHVFEPYFSRKAGGHGVGLSTVYGIVKRWGGTIALRSAPGAGTTFTVGLPRPAPAEAAIARQRD